jgi:hypothetical protein
MPAFASIEAHQERLFSRSAVFALGKPLLEAERLHGIERSHLDYHLKLLVEAKLIEAVEKPGTAYGWYVRRLTCDGHEFLDTIRDPEIWAKTKAGASASGAWSIGLLKDIGAAYVKMKAKEVLGFEIG